jgi:polyisoprenoid-binding protein YceI
MADKAGLEVRTRDTNHGLPRPPRKHRRRQWIIASVTALVVLVVLVVLVAVSVTPQPGPPPLALPTASATAPAPAGPVDGTWNLGAGSVAGFRVRESFLGRSDDVVGRTNTVTGTIAVSHNQLTSARFRIDLTTIKVKDKTPPQFAKSLDTQRYPSATLTLTQPITLNADLNTGATITATATGQLTLHGVTRVVSFPISGRHSGSALQAAGSIPITFSDWGIQPPKNYGPLGSLAHHGVAEFLLILHRQ